MILKVRTFSQNGNQRTLREKLGPFYLINFWVVAPLGVVKAALTSFINIPISNVCRGGPHMV